MADAEITVSISSPEISATIEQTEITSEIVAQGPIGPTGPQGPQGIQGIQGNQGIQGPVGPVGASSYTYIAYASDDSGTDFTAVFDTNLDYIAILTTDTEIETPSVGDFAGLWKNYKGAQGVQGIQGIQGEAGDDAYVYVAYASDDTGTGFTTTFNAALDYIAIKSSTTPLTPVVGDFAGLWKNYKGATGAQGPQGDPGTGEIPGGVTDNLVTINASDQIQDSGVSINAIPNKAIGSEVDTGTDDAKFVTAKAINDSHNVPSVAPGTSGNLMTSNGTDWTSAAPPVSVSVTTKGDIQTHDADSPERLPVGTDGQILEARASETTGLKWVTPVKTSVLEVQVFS